MSTGETTQPKPLFWIGSTYKDLKAFPAEVRQAVGSAHFDRVYEKAVGWRRTPQRGLRPTGTLSFGGTLPFGGCPPSAVSVGLASMNRGSVPSYASPTTFSYTLSEL